VWFDKNGSRIHEGGFNAVIGNPPYVSFGLGGTGGLTEKEKNYHFTNHPDGAEYKISYYALFMDLGVHLAKESGLLSYIVPDMRMELFTPIQSYIPWKDILLMRYKRPGTVILLPLIPM